jgi:hypothetical protein
MRLNACCLNVSCTSTQRFDIIFGSDVVYASADIRPLLRCAVGLLARHGAARLVLAMMLKMFGYVRAGKTRKDKTREKKRKDREN